MKHTSSLVALRFLVLGVIFLSIDSDMFRLSSSSSPPFLCCAYLISRVPSSLSKQRLSTKVMTLKRVERSNSFLDSAYRLSIHSKKLNYLKAKRTRVFSSSTISSSEGSEKEVGFIGLGIMGNGMARCLLKEKVPLRVWNRSIEKSKQIQEEYPNLVTIASSPAEVVSGCSLTFSMLSTPEACDNVYNAKDTGILAGINANSQLVDCATLESKDMLRFGQAVSEKGGKFLEAPVSGSKGPAENGQLIFLSAGEKSVYEGALRYFEIMGKSSYHLGCVGKGTEMKLIANMMMGSMLSSLAEGMSLCSKVGLNQTELIEILSQGAMANPMFNLKGPLIAKDEHNPNFPLKHAHKDMKFALSLAKTVGAQVKIAEEGTKYMQNQINKGDGDLDFSVLARNVNEKVCVQETELQK